LNNTLLIKKGFLILEAKPSNRLILMFLVYPETEIIQLLLSDGKLIKRPFLISGEKIILGFNEGEYLNQLLTN